MIADASNPNYNGTFPVITLSGNDITCVVPGPEQGNNNGSSGTATFIDGAGGTGGTATVVSGTHLKYSYNGFGRAAREGLSGTTYAYLDSGYPTGTISTGWRMYDPLLNTMVQYNGSAWVTNPTTYTWAFDYPKYLARYAWAHPSGFTPTHVSILLGANDFRSVETAESSIFATAVATWVASYRAMVTNIRLAYPAPVVIVTLPTMGASQDGHGGNSSLGTLAERARRNLQTVTAALLAEFDKPADRSNGIRVAPFGGGVDPIYGFSLPAPVAPNRHVTDSSLFIRRATDEVHPSLSGYNQGGDWIAASVQASR